jgi:NTP pyrophosphatase (non-canonical NTP hydrolase)
VRVAVPASPCLSSGLVELRLFQDAMQRTYGERDAARGQAATVAWLAEELGELARAARKGTREEQVHELGDVLAWLASLANQLGISLDEAAARYADGCPKCGAEPCSCQDVPGEPARSAAHDRRGETQ